MTLREALEKMHFVTELEIVDDDHTFFRGSTNDPDFKDCVIDFLNLTVLWLTPKLRSTRDYDEYTAYIEIKVETVSDNRNALAPR